MHKTQIYVYKIYTYIYIYGTYMRYVNMVIYIIIHTYVNSLKDWLFWGSNMGSMRLSSMVRSGGNCCGLWPNHRFGELGCPAHVGSWHGLKVNYSAHELLHYIIFYYICYIIIYCNIIHIYIYIVFYYIIWYYIVLYCFILCYIVFYYVLLLYQTSNLTRIPNIS